MIRSRKEILTAGAVVLVSLTPFYFVQESSAQTIPPEAGASQAPGNDGGQQLSIGARQTQNTVPNSPYYDADGRTSLVQQAAEQNIQQTIANTNDQLLQGSELAQYNDTYAGLKAFWGDDMISNFFANIGQVIGRWITELIDGWVSDTVQFLTAFLRTFVLNPNIAVNGLTVTPNAADGLNKSDDISPYIRQGADTMYGIAVDLLLLLFILCIWKYWVDAAWRGGANLMGTVGRLIFTSGLLLAWPTIYAFEIQISNEMIKAIYFNSADQVMMLDAAMASAVKGGLVAGVGLLANTFAPVVGSIVGGIAGGGAMGTVLGTVGGVVAFAGLLIYLVLGGILIAELIYILVLKAIQTALLTAQYMFAPIFIVFFATPDTENVCSGFVKSFVEVSLWTFVWVGLLKILVIILFSDFNPWGKIIIAIGILQLMIQTPSFMARAQISPMSDFISAGLIAGGLMKGVGALGNLAQTTTGQFFQYGMTDKFAARGLSQSQKVSMENLPQDVANPELLQNLRSAADGKVNKNNPPLGPDGLPIKPPDGPAGGPSGGPGAAPTVTPPEKKDRIAKDENQNSRDENQKSKDLNQSAVPSTTSELPEPASKKKEKMSQVTKSDANAGSGPFNPLFKNGMPELKSSVKAAQATDSKSDHNTSDQGKKINSGVQPNLEKAVKSNAGNAEPKRSGSSTEQDSALNEDEGIFIPGFDAQGQPLTIKAVLMPRAKHSDGKGDLEIGAAQGGVGAMPPKSGQGPEFSVKRHAPGSLTVGPLAPATGTGARVVTHAQNPVALKQGRHIDPSTSFMPEQLQENIPEEETPALSFGDKVIPPTAKRGEPFQSFSQHNYVWVPGRDFGVAVRTAQGPTIGPSVDGKPNIVGNAKGQVNHVRFGAGATPEQQALQTFVAGFAQVFSSDSEGFDAARQSAIDAKEDGPQGLLERAAAGFMAHNGGSFKQTAVAKQRMQKAFLKHAIIGAEAYMTMQPGNAFTEFLTGRFGEMTPDRQAWGVHIMTDETSPESPWNPKVGPATESCAAAGVPIGGHRAAAANPAVLKQPAWGRGPAIRGVAAYASAIVDSKVPENTHPMVVDALFGREAPNVGSAEVGACLAIMLESPSTEAGQLACSNTDMVQSVAQLVAGGHQKDYVSAYRSLNGMVRTIGGSSAGGRINSTDTVRVDLRAHASPQGRSGPDISSFVPEGSEPQAQEQVRQVVEFNVAPSDEIGYDTTSSASINFGVDTPATSSNPEVRITGDTGSKHTVTSEHFVTAYGENSSSFAPDAAVSDVATMAAASATAKNSIYHAQQLIIDMHSAGFSDDQIQDPRIAATALQVYEHDASMLGTAAITARIMGPSEFNKSSTQVVQQMVDCGWSANKISRPDVYTAHSIMQGGGSPTPSVVQTIRMMPEFNPRPNVALPQQVVDGAQSSGGFDAFLGGTNSAINRY